MLSYEEFKEKVKKELINYLPEGYTTDMLIETENMLNNGVAFEAITIAGKSNLRPSLYYDHYYREYYYGQHSMEEILSTMADAYIKVSDVRLDIRQYDQLKDHIFVMVCNAEKNSDLLKRVPHERKEDLALVYRATVKLDETTKGSFIITDNCLIQWGITEEEFKKGIFEKMRKDRPPEFQSIESVLMGMMIGDEDSALLDKIETSESGLYVLSNADKVYGAAYMFDEKVMSDIAEQLNADLVILPSSINEVIILREDENMDYDELKDIVRLVNATQVVETEMLSDEIYHFDRDTLELSIVPNAGMEQRMEL